MHFTRNTLGKQERLKSRKRIKELFENGQVMHHFPFKVLYKCIEIDGEPYPAKFAVSVSKRNFKLAVDRNRIKRRIREAYRLNKTPMYNQLVENDQKLILFVIYSAKEELDFGKIEKELKLLLAKLTLRLNESTSEKSNIRVKKS